MAGNLTKLEVAQLKEAFALFDNKKDGQIDAEELKVVMDALGQACTGEEIKELIEIMDTSGYERIDFPAFLTQFQHEDDDDPLEMLDEAFDLVGGGQPFTADNVKQFLGSLGCNIIDMEANEIIKSLDKDGDGKVGADDFKKAWLEK
eukprot:386356_1